MYCNTSASFHGTDQLLCSSGRWAWHYSTSCRRSKEDAAFPPVTHLAKGHPAPPAWPTAHAAAPAQSTCRTCPARNANASASADVAEGCSLEPLDIRQATRHPCMQLVNATQVTPQVERALPGRSGSWQEPPPAASLGTRKAADRATLAPQVHTNGCMHSHKAVRITRCAPCDGSGFVYKCRVKNWAPGTCLLGPVQPAAHTAALPALAGACLPPVLPAIVTERPQPMCAYTNNPI